MNKGGEANGAGHAATQTFEAQRDRFSRCAQERKKDGHAPKLYCLDVRKASPNGVTKRRLYVRLPAPLGLDNHAVGLSKRCMYGTRGAGASREAAFTSKLLAMGFHQGSASPVCCYHPEWDVSLAVLGDDFPALGTDASIDKYEHATNDAFEVELKGKLGEETHDATEVKILSRTVGFSPEGLVYGTDSRHAGLHANGLEFEMAKPKFTHAAGKLTGDDTWDNDPDYERKICAVLSSLPAKQREIRFNGLVTLVEVPDGETPLVFIHENVSSQAGWAGQSRNIFRGDTVPSRARLALVLKGFAGNGAMTRKKRPSSSLTLTSLDPVGRKHPPHTHTHTMSC